MKWLVLLLSLVMLLHLVRLDQAIRRIARLEERLERQDDDQFNILKVR